MHTTKLQEYINITKLLMEKGPQNFSQITSITRINKTFLDQDLKFLLGANLIFENLRGQYSIAKSGINILTFFNIASSEKTIKMKR